MRTVSRVAISVFRESVRDRVPYNLVLFAVLLISSSYLIGQLTAGQDIKIIKDLGLSATSVFGLFIAIFIGIGLVSKEVERRSIYALLAKPDSWLGANLVVLALASVAASSIATLLAQRTGYEHAIPITMAALSVFMIVFCELAKKIFAALKPNPVALSSTYIYKVLVVLMTPFSWFANKAAYGFLRLFGVKPVRPDGAAMSRPTSGTNRRRATIPGDERQMASGCSAHYCRVSGMRCVPC